MDCRSAIVRAEAFDLMVAKYDDFPAIAIFVVDVIDFRLIIIRLVDWLLIVFGVVDLRFVIVWVDCRLIVVRFIDRGVVNDLIIVNAACGEQ
jgi:hypothetical protein